ncbi:MAG TPA: PQQ-dependent dehydrogenase, methanol/ethanol family [Gammaproteobacteria bacterium]|nr:PQQ-dependent dehydrogenase, methanol/ethanol family [Gammaproteobacteria bacterium]
MNTNSLARALLAAGIGALAAAAVSAQQNAPASSRNASARTASSAAPGPAAASGGSEGPAAAEPAVADYHAVTEARLLDPEARNWLMYRGAYSGWGYSRLDQITARNVAELRPAWTLSTGVREGHEAPPIVNDGVMFITTPGDQVYAVDAVSGDVLWQYRRQLPYDLRQLHPTNRGVALYGDKVYIATVDAALVALDAASGKIDWETKVEDYHHGYYITMAPLAAKGKIMVGVSGGELGIRGFVAAFDADTGKPAWKTYTIPSPGEPGSKSWPGDTWKTGGAPVWVTGTYDPALNVSYWGTGNGGPWTGDRRPGDNLYTNSVLALDVDTGKLEGYHQYHWNGSWDWDEIDAPLLVDVERGGRMLKALVHPGRDGYLWWLERKPNGSIGFIDAKPYVKQNVFTSIDPKTGRPSYDKSRRPTLDYRASFCPSSWGGKDWPPAAYSPQTGLIYIPANNNLCTSMQGEEVEYRPGSGYSGVKSQFYVAEGADHIGELQAWNVNTGKRVWTHDFPVHDWGPVLATAGGLVFQGGTQDRYFRAFDARTGKLLWKMRTNSGIIGVPVSYEVGGKQYIAVLSGWGVDAARMQGAIDRSRGTHSDTPQGGVLWVFALPDDAVAQ